MLHSQRLSRAHAPPQAVPPLKRGLRSRAEERFLVPTLRVQGRLSLHVILAISYPGSRPFLLRKSGGARSRIGALRDDICGLRKFSPSRERSELSFFLNSPCSTLNGFQEHTPHRKRSPPAQAGIKIKSRRAVLRSDASRSGSWFLPATHNAQPTAVLTAREAELARSSRTGIAKRYWRRRSLYWLLLSKTFHTLLCTSLTTRHLRNLVGHPPISCISVGSQESTSGCSSSEEYPYHLLLRSLLSSVFCSFRPLQRLFCL